MEGYAEQAWAVVLARGGSKSVPLKNIHMLGKLPLIAYCLRSLRLAQSVDRIIVSTDHPEIAAVATKHGAEVHVRPEEFSGDDVSSEAVLRAILNEYGQVGNLPEISALIQPTSPFVTPATIDTCMEKLRACPDASSVQSITPISHHSHAINQRRLEGDRVEFVFPELRAGKTGKQHKVAHYSLGNFIAVHTRQFLNGDSLFGRNSIVGCTVSRYEALDVDTLEDFQQAEIYLGSGILNCNLTER